MIGYITARFYYVCLCVLGFIISCISLTSHMFYHNINHWVDRRQKRGTVPRPQSHLCVESIVWCAVLHKIKLATSNRKCTLGISAWCCCRVLNSPLDSLLYPSLAHLVLRKSQHPFVTALGISLPFYTTISSRLRLNRLNRGKCTGLLGRSQYYRYYAIHLACLRRRQQPTVNGAKQILIIIKTKTL